MFLGNSFPIIGKTELPTIRLLFAEDLNGSSFACVVQGIVEQIAEDAIEQHRIAVNDNILLHVVFQGHVTVGKLNGNLLHDIRHEVGDVHAHKLQLISCIIQAVEHRHVFQQSSEALCLKMGALNKLVLGFGRDVWILKQGFGITQYTCDRCLQFVGDIVSQFTTHLAFFFCLFTLDTFVHTPRITAKLPGKHPHHNDGEHEQVPVTCLLKGL